MTTLRFSFSLAILLCWVASSPSANGQAVTVPGRKVETAAPVSPDAWYKAEGGGGFVLLGGPNTNEVQITPEIQSLARALDNDPRQIYEYVLNNVDYVSLFGSRNGATATLFAKRGNDLDHCALLIALLKAANPASDARYIEAQVVYSTSFLGGLLGINGDQVLSHLGNCHIPAAYYASSSYIQMYHYWVETTINGTNYVLDTAFKEYDSTTALDILSIAGYSRTQFLARAVSGATVTTNSIRNANESNIRADLTTYSTNLLGYIRANYPNAERSAVLGGRRIRRQTVTSLPTSLPYALLTVPGTRYEYTTLPSTYFWRMTIQHQGINQTVRLYECAGKRVSVFYTGAGNAPQLRVDGTLIATGSATTTGQVYNMTVSLARPNATAVSNVFTLTSGKSYVIANDFGAACPALIANVSEQLARDRASGLSETSETVLGGSLHLMSLSYFNQFMLQQDMVSRMAQVLATEHYDIGLMAQEVGYYIDIPLARVSVRHVSGDSAKATALVRSTSLLQSSLEHGMLEQMQGTNRPGASTVKLLKLSNSNNKETYFANSANWSGPSGVRTQLVNYTAQELAQLDSYIGSGMTALLPKDAAITLAQWTGVGYVVYDAVNTGMLIKGNYKGGYSGYQGTVQSGSVQNQTVAAYVPLPSANIVRPQSLEPVDLATGDYLFENADLSLGGDEPRGVKLVRYYNSAQSFQDNRLRYGWTHNYNIRAAVHSNPDLALGQRQACDAASLAVYSLIASDLLENELNIRGWVTASLATKWAMDQLIENAVNIQLGNKTLTFIKLADGSYSPPQSVTASLTGSNGAFRLNERFGVRYEFNANNLISAWRDADTNTLSFSYNAQTNLSTVTDPYSRTLTFTYSGATQLSSVADSSGRSVSYGYSAGNLTSFTDPEGKVWSYSYDSNRWMRALTDPLSQVTASNTYDGTGMVVTQRNGKGVSWAFFVVSKWRGIEQDPFGARMTYYFDAEGRQASIADPLGNRRYFGYDGQGHVTNEIDARGFQTIYQYDPNHKRTNTVDALGNAAAFTYDSQHRLVSVRDALAHTTQYGYDSEHHLTNVVDALGNRTLTTYYANGLPQTVTGPRGEATSYTYDSYGTPATIARTDGGTETRTWNARGDLLTLTDANTNTTTFTYDKRRLLTSARDPFSRAVSNIYNNAGLLVTNIDKRAFATAWTWTATYKERSVRYPDGGTVSNFFDLADRVILVRDPLGFFTTNQYDAAGRLIRVINPLGHAVSNRYDQSGNLVSVRDPAGNEFSNQFDALNRLVKMIDPLGYSVSNEYNAVGWLVATVDQTGKRTEFEYDAVGRVTLERRGALEFEFEYDASGNRTAFVNAKSARMGFGYDRMNRRVAETNALGQVTQLSYDPVGNLRQRVNANGETTYFYYNALNLLTSRQSALENVSFSYDPSGNLTNLVDSLGTTRQTFDALNRLTRVIDPFGQTVSNQYNLAGRRTQITYPDGKTEQFGYDGNRRLTNVLASAFGLSTVTYGYDSRNNLTGANLPGGLTAAYAYDAMSRASSWSVSKAGSNLLQRSCTRDGMGFKATESIQAGLEALDAAVSQDRQHNTADQIQSVVQTDPSATNIPAHDAAGNTTQIVVSARGQTFTTLYRYDYNSRLLLATRLRNAPSGQAVTTSVTQLEYDGLGLLSRITENGSARRLVRDRTDQLARPILETDASGNAVRWFVWANGCLLAQVGSNSVIRCPHFDELGRLLAFTDNNGTQTDEYAYQPYGRLIGHSGATDTPFTWLGAFGVWYAGQGLYLTRYRAYDANLMRFVQADPLGLDGDRNLYIYGRANPYAVVDPLGLYGFGYGPNLGGGAGQDYDPESIPYNSAVNSITAGPGSVERQYGMFDLIVDGGFVAGAGATGAGIYSAAVTYGPAVAAAGAGAYAAGQDAFYRLMATQPGNVLNELILYYPQSTPARATTAELIASAQPYVAQFVSGVLPGPGGPYANRREAYSWLAGKGAGEIYEAANSLSPGAPAASTPRTTSSGSSAPAIRK
ncbi:MAG: hypothetical protein KJ626_06120 [Verrucomicrobia bacterium]|nr:hypothetical protein [Verrucomicrobiota bacterium]